MTPKNSGKGTSFSGACKYALHDVNAETNERVAWTRTFNLANDDIPSAINEMYLTAENAELLKREAGIRAGGRPTENSCKHISLNWSPEDNPSQEHMIKSAEHFMEYMRWGEYQAIFIAHSDKAHKHLHIIMNAVHPETGRHCDERWENNRMSMWAAEYERAQDCIRCPQRALPYEEREKAMPRNMWTAFQQNEKSFYHAEYLLRENPGEVPENISINSSEWKILKNIQRAEREDFFTDGKRQFAEVRNAVWQSVREEFKDRWAEYHRAKETSTDAEILRGLKRGIIDDRNAVFEPRRDAACLELRNTRDAQYREILDSQREQRQTLKWHQNLGLDTSDFFHELRARGKTNVVTEDFRQASREVTQHAPLSNSNDQNGRDFVNAAVEVGERPLAGATSFAASIFGSFFTTLTNLGSARPEPISYADREERARLVAEEATSQREQTARNLDDEDWRKRSKELYGRE